MTEGDGRFLLATVLRQPPNLGRAFLPACEPLIQIIARLLRIRCGFRTGLPEYSSAHFRVSRLVGMTIAERAIGNDDCARVHSSAGSRRFGHFVRDALAELLAT